MAVESNGLYNLDLTDLIEPIRVKIGDTIYSLANDLPLPLVKRLGRFFTSLGGQLGDDDDNAEKLVASNEVLWALTDEVLSKATPKLTAPARELLTTQAAMKLLSFLTVKFSESLTGAAT